MAVHNETSTGVTSNIAGLRRAMDAAQHPALLMVDTVSSLAAIDYRHDEWGVDVTVSGLAKRTDAAARPGLQRRQPEGAGSVEDVALAQSVLALGRDAGLNANGFFPYTPATNLLYGLREALAMLLDEGLENVFARHNRLAEATRRAVTAWELEIWAARSQLSTAVPPRRSCCRRASNEAAFAPSSSTASICRSAPDWAN